MSGPLVFQPNAAQLRDKGATMRAHDAQLDRALVQKHAKRLVCLAQRAAARLKARPHNEARS